MPVKLFPEDEKGNDDIGKPSVPLLTKVHGKTLKRRVGLVHCLLHVPLTKLLTGWIRWKGLRHAWINSRLASPLGTICSPSSPPHECVHPAELFHKINVRNLDQNARWCKPQGNVVDVQLLAEVLDDADDLLQISSFSRVDVGYVYDLHSLNTSKRKEGSC